MHDDSIEKVLAKTEYVEQVEIIPVVKYGQRMVLLRARNMPEFAFALWADETQGTYSQLSFRMPDNSQSRNFSVVCACCGCEKYGIEIPKEKVGEWEPVLKALYKEAIEKTCESNNIRVLFMRRAYTWAKHYGETDVVNVVEALNHRATMAAFWGQRKVEETMKFIHRESQGMFE